MLIKIYYVWNKFKKKTKKNPANTDKLDQKIEDVCYFTIYSEVSQNWYNGHVMLWS